MTKMTKKINQISLYTNLTIVQKLGQDWYKSHLLFLLHCILVNIFYILGKIG